MADNEDSIGLCRSKLLRTIAPSLIVGAIFGVLHHMSSELFISANLHFDYAAQDWFHSNPAMEFWHGIVWIAAGIGIALALGITSKSKMIAILQGFLFGFFIPLFSMLALNIDSFSNLESFGWLIRALPIYLVFGLLLAVVGGLVSMAGYGGKYFFKGRHADDKALWK